MITMMSVSVTAVLSSFVVGVFFFIYHIERDRFLLYFGYAWLFFAFAFCSLMVSFFIHRDFFLGCKKVFIMYAIIAIIFAVYRCAKKEIPDFWLRFAIYLTIWFFIGQYINLDRLSEILPIAVLDIAAGCITCITLIKNISKSFFVRVYACLMTFFFVGLEVYLSLSELHNPPPYEIYFIETLAICIITINALLIYFKSVKERLTRTENQFEYIVENSQDAFFYFVLRPDSHFDYITPSIEKITGYSAQMFYKSPYLIREIVHKNDFETINKMFFPSTDTDPGDSFRHAKETLRIITKSKEERWIEIQHNPVVSERPAEQKVVALNGMIRDVDDSIRFQTEMIESKKSKELMFSYVSHELKTPVTLLLGYASALKDGTLETKDEADNAVNIIVEESKLMERMINDLAQLSQLETNQFSFTYEYMSCLDFASAIRKNCSPELVQAGIPYVWNIDDKRLEGLDLIVDLTRIGQVVTNLITNAIKYTRPKNKIAINIGTDKARENVIIKVADRGIGITSKDLPHIFESFYKITRHGGKKVNSRGLGLSIAKQIVEAHNGTIDVESTYGKGSVFTVSLPIEAYAN